MSSVLGIRWMLPLGLDKAYNRIVMAAAVVDIALVLALFRWQKALGMAWAVLLTEIFIVAAVFILLWRRKLNPFQKEEARVESGSSLAC